MKQANEPEFMPLPGRGRVANAFVPRGWKLVETADGDLNKDGHSDLFMVMRQTDAAKVQAASTAGNAPFDTNPYRLAVAFFDPRQNDYVLVAEDHHLIPRHEDRNFEDPFDDIDVDNGLLELELSRFANMGGWGTETRALLFRWQDGAFRLIGLDSTRAQRNTGEYTSHSVNYLTHRMKTEVGHDDDEGDGRVSWKSIPKEPLRTLGKMGDGLSLKLPPA